MDDCGQPAVLKEGGQITLFSEGVLFNLGWDGVIYTILDRD